MDGWMDGCDGIELNLISWISQVRLWMLEMLDGLDRDGFGLRIDCIHFLILVRSSNIGQPSPQMQHHYLDFKQILLQIRLANILT